ncbi:MAG: ABC transporter ATP-binding protein [Fimbriimonadaceae bacterium]|nr:ABC transporter ATP-binding protein [Chitinophagales bacterium]
MLRVKNISKSFATNKAVDDVSFQIEKGQFYGLLGPNGAGKTTTILMISAIMQPDIGNILIDEKDVYKNKHTVKLKMGIVPQEIALYDEMSALDNLVFWGSLYGISKSNAKQKANELLDWIGLSDRKKDLIKTYSGGMKRRINIACALMHNPELIVMDEPTVGIDPQSRNKIYELLDELHNNKKTILYTTHYMEEAERMCDIIGIIDRGKIITQGTLQELKNKNNVDESIVIHYEGNAVDKLNGYKLKNDADKNELIIYSQHAKHDLPGIVKKCADAGITILNIDIRNINLETIFLNLTGRQLRD